MIHRCLNATLLLILCSPLEGQQKEPIIDVHLHSLGPHLLPDGRGAPIFCPNDRVPCDNKPSAFTSDTAVITGVLGEMKRNNVVLAVLLGGPLEDQFLRAGGNRFMRAVTDGFTGGPSADSARAILKSGTAKAIGELGPPYLGVSPADTMFAPYFALAEEFDVPVLVHGAGIGARVPRYLVEMGHPLLLEGVLKKHPRLRLYVENAGYPFGDEMIALLYMYPNVYVDVSTITWIIPRTTFHDYLQRIVRAGFGDRIMFGSDELGFPEVISTGVQAIETASFLTPAQRRDILYNNAARFPKLTLDGVPIGEPFSSRAT
jgi:hypothetical protein